MQPDEKDFIVNRLEDYIRSLQTATENIKRGSTVETGYLKEKARKLKEFVDSL